MRIFGFELRKFEEEKTTIEAIETWCVKWSSLHKSIINMGDPKINVQGFPTKQGADIYAKELKDARRLLGDKGFDVVVYMQKTHSNT
jgi:hypothetical protein